MDVLSKWCTISESRYNEWKPIQGELKRNENMARGRRRSERNAGREARKWEKKCRCHVQGIDRSDAISGLIFRVHARERQWLARYPCFFPCSTRFALHKSSEKSLTQNQTPPRRVGDCEKERCQYVSWITWRMKTEQVNLIFGLCGRWKTK